MNEPILTMTGICKSFGVPVLKDAHFDLLPGEVHALVGGNGAGKSTLMKILTGVYRPDAGRIALGGKEVSFQSYEEASAGGVRMIFQELSNIPTMTVAENIFLNSEPKTRHGLIDKERMIRKAKALLDDLEVDIDPRTRIASLGVGYCQMVEIAKALSREASVLVLDEPTASLSDPEVAVLFGIIERLKKRGVSMVYISHRMNEIMSIADRITILRDGANVITRPLAGMTLNDIISNMLGFTAQSHGLEWKPRTTVSAEPMLEVRDLVVPGAEPISFTINKGEIVGLAGLLGSGRSELAEALFGIAPASSGAILVDGKEVRIRTVANAIEAGIALVPEDRRRQGLVLDHSVRENIITPVLKNLSGRFLIRHREADSLVDRFIREFNVKTDGRDKVVSLLSGGNQQKVVISKWLSIQPKVLVLDEPTAGIDINAKGEIVEIIRTFADAGNAVLMISSEFMEMLAVCDRILVIYNGRLTGDIPRDAISSEEELQHAIQVTR
ncbi:MAG: sugar ABC transporter ATP-binding protein [Planctomycetaceae bacterium]|nr:sugar ABC transporter ATP-binding protein [Planctomycetaceae bacterium]